MYLQCSQSADTVAWWETLFLQYGDDDSPSFLLANATTHSDADEKNQGIQETGVAAKALHLLSIRLWWLCPDLGKFSCRERGDSLPL